MLISGYSFVRTLNGRLKLLCLLLIVKIWVYFFQTVFTMMQFRKLNTQSLKLRFTVDIIYNLNKEILYGILAAGARILSKPLLQI